MRVHKYKNYDEYVSCQKSAFQKKFENIWAKKENIKAIAEYLKKYTPRDGICHGVRQGYEQKWFMENLPNCRVLGTDIGEIDEIDGLTIQWDFNKKNENWIRQFDFLYSNSFDHAFSPEKTFQIWSEQVRIGGHIILEYDRRQEHTGEISKKYNKTDPISITIEELQQKIPEWTDGNAKIEKVLDMPVVTQEWRKTIICKVTN